MKKPTIFKVFIAALLVLLSISSHAQLRKNFNPRKTTSLNGDILVIGNNILNRDNGNGQRPKDPYNDLGSNSKLNDNFNMKYIDIDSDSDTYNSSSAKLTIPQASKACYEIEYAALYWGATYRGSNRSKINEVKLKSPTDSDYKKLTGTLLFDEGGAGVSNPYVAKPYACFIDITDAVKTAKEGVYTVADIVTTEGQYQPGASAAGWSIFVIYKDPLLPNKYITSYDGFSIIRSSDDPLDIPISGFRTNPFGDVNVKLAFSALEGDNPLEGDGLFIKGAKSTTWGAISSLVRPIRVSGGRSTPNFFNSSISDGDVYMMDRVPNSKNTLGYDAGVVKIDNRNNSIIQNDETSATLRISTSSDSYYMFFNALAVEIIAPKIVLRKNALDKDGKNINGQPVTLNQELQYEINFRNEGNDNAKNFTITDELPKNVIFGGLGSITMDSRITATYDATTRKLVFTVPDAMVVANGAATPYSIKFKVRVVDDCNELIDACANRIENIAFSKYYGVKNTTPEGFGEGSYSTISQCNVGEPTATNFLVGIDKCLFSRDVSICGTATLTAALGYKTYVWRDPNGVIFGGNNRTVTINKPGKYTVNNSGAENCEPIQQTFNVTDYLAGKIENPVKGDNIDPATGLAFACVRDNKPFPKIFLCGLNDKREIDTKITGATKVTWQETKDVPPDDQPNPESCPYEGATNWTTIVDNNTKFTADRAGVFRIVVNYGNTCVVTHYFNVYQNKLDPKAEKQDIVCDTKGRITITNPPENTGYSYSLNGTDYQTSSTFNNVAKGSYKVQIRQTVLIDGQMSACPFFVDVNVEELVLTTDISATHPICTGQLGTITASINTVPGQYKFVLRKKGSTTEIQNTGLIDDNFKVFTGVEPGVYEVDMSTAKNGCKQTKEIEVFDYRLSAQAKVTKDLSGCGDGEITITVTGGTPRTGPPPYYMYYINDSADFVTNPVLTVTPETLPADGIFNIVVTDDKGCSVTIPPIKMVPVAKPTVTFKGNDVRCYGTDSGQIDVTVTATSPGYVVSYSVDGGSFSSISPITNLAVGDHSVVVKYVYAGVECTDPPQTVKIGGPAGMLTASAGVSELSGCGPTGFEKQGKIRITNVQGGTPLYKYSFDDQKTWIDENEAYVNPGKYTVYVKDKNECIYAMSNIVLDEKPADPSIDPNPVVVYNCDGTGNTTITVTNTGGANYTYEYYIDTKPNTPITSNVFTNVPTGKHEITVKYKLVAATTFSNLLKEDFGSGKDEKLTGIHPNYCWEKQDYITDCGHGLWHDYLLNDGEYVVTKGILPDHRNDFGWVIPVDHTSNGSDINGRYLAVNIGGAVGIGGIIYSKPIVDIIPNQDIKVEFYALNLLLKDNQKVKPNLTIELHKNGVAIPGASVNTADILQNEQWNLIDGLTINPGPNSSLDFVIRSNSDREDGNDLCVDDILVYQLPKSCIAERKMEVIIETNKAFKVSEPEIDDATCGDVNNGKITIAVENFDTTNGFKYSIDNGQNWNTSTTSPVTIEKLPKGNYKIIVKNDDAGFCTSTFDKEIKAPITLTTTASITKDATCIVGASITAVPQGGSPAYQYELYYTNGTLYESSTVATFTNVPEGTYYVIVKDKSSCASTASDPIDVKRPLPPRITLDGSSDLCYDAANKATLVVKVEGGLAPFFYSLNGGNAQKDNNKFEVGPGTYSIAVTDANGCVAEAITGIEIAKEIKAVPEITKLLDCTSSPEAEITIHASLGYPTYKYQVSTDGGNNFADMTSNVYKADKVGSYIFKVTDSKGCSVTTSAVNVNAKLTPTASIVSQTDPKCNNESTGQFTVQAAGGSGPTYEYKFNGGNYGASATYSNLNAFVGAVNTRTYTYQVKDSKGCESPVYEVTLTNPTKVSVSGSFQANTTCSTTTVVTILGDGGTGTYQYNFDGGSNYNGTTTKTITLTNAEQTVKFYVKDANGCTAEGEVKVPAFNPPTRIDISDPAAITCKVGGTTTSLTLTAVNGIAPFTYEVTSGPVTPTAITGNTATFTGLTAGFYEFKVTDARGCTTTGSKTIAQGVKIKAEGSKTDEKCFEAKNGSVSFTVSDVSSTGNFDYTITPNSGTPSVSGNTITRTNLAPGKYTFVATDRTTGCVSESVEVTVGAATAIDFTVNATKISCNNTVATLTISNISGGKGTYTYAFVRKDATAPTTYGTSLTVDTAVLTTNIDVYVKDVNNCAVKKSISILTEDAPIINPIAAQCYPGSPIAVTIDGTFARPATFSKDGNKFESSDTFNLTPGTYKLTVKDKFGCEAFINYVVPEQLTITPAIVPDATCTTETTISLSSTGGTGTRSYAVSIDNGTYNTVTSPYTATAAGTYKFRVSDSANPTCYAYTADIPVTLKATTFTINPSKTDVKCNGAATGTISISTTAGKAPYTYSVTKATIPVSTTALTTGLTAGVYDIVVTDHIGCTGTAQVTILQPDLLEANATIDPFTCSPTNAKESKDVTVTVTGGVAPYTYSFNGSSYGDDSTFSVSDNGNPQSVTYSVKDANGCTTQVETLDILPLNPPKITSVNASVIYCDPIGSRTSTVKVNLTAGTGTGTVVYTIVSGPTINTTGATDGEFKDLTPGSYVFRVTDGSGCYADFSKNIPAVVAIRATPTKLNDVYCKGGSTGNIRFNVTNFTSTYSYKVNSEPTVTGRNETVFTLANRPVGVYNVVFVDETTNCTVTEQVEIFEPNNPLDLVIDSNVNSNCGIITSTVTVHATGGTIGSGYQYAILDADDTTSTPIYGPNPVFNINSNSGADLNWVIYAKDANGCIVSRNVTIARDTQPTVTLDVPNQCSASGTSFTIVASGANGVVPYTYTINTGVAPSPANTFTVGAGTYVVTITDANGCTNTETVTVNDAMIATAVRKKDLTCTAISPTDASIEVNVTGGNPSFGYRVRMLPAAFTGTPIPFTSTRSFVYSTGTAGTYEFEITDGNNCPKLTNTVIVNPTTTVTATYTPTNPTCNAGTDGVVELRGTAGEAPFKYNFNGLGFGDKYIFGGLTAGSYSYTVRDAKGCEFNGTAVLTEPAPIDGLVEGTPIICDLNTLGTFKVSVLSGGVAPFVYTLYDSNRNQLQTYTETSASPTAVHTFAGLNFGYYYVTIVDANGCKFETSRLRIETPPYLKITTTADSFSCATGVNVTVTTTGGEGPYTYSIFGQAETAPIASNSYTFTGLAHNRTYYLQVKDKNNCISIAEEITPPSPSTIKITATSQTDATCAGSANGILNFTVEDYDPTVTTIRYRILDELTQLPLTTPIGDDLTGPAGGPVSETINNLPAGNYTLEVTEVGGTLCSTSYTFRIDQPAQPLNSVITNLVPANCNSGAIVTMRTTGGTAPYYYGVAVSPAMPTDFTSTNNVIELDPSSGTDWNIVVRDSKGCEVGRAQIIPVDSSPDIDLQIVDRCATEGNFSVNVIETTAGKGAYSISVDSDNSYSPLTGGLPYTVTNLTSGSHRIYIKDANGCVDFEDININAPLDLQPAVVSTDPTCTSVNGGSITLTTTGGTGTYTYTIDAAGATVTNNVISNLAYGNYTVTVTDGYCNTTVPVELKAPIPVTFDADVVDVACYNGATGSITVNLLPGNTETPYTYAIASATADPLPLGIVLIGNKFTNVPQGSYAITVTSGKGCPTTHTFDVDQPTAAVGAIAAVDPYNCNPSNTVQQAVVRVTGTGGSGSYKYNFDGGTTYTDDNELFVTDDTTVQRINYYVMDSNGCTYSNFVDVNPYQQLATIDFAVVTAPVCSRNVADIRVDVTGGYTPYAKYEIISPITRDNLNSDTFTGLAPNVNYLFRVTDANGCYIEGNYTVAPVVPINIVRTSFTNVSCNTLNGTSNNGSATFTVSDFSVSGDYTVSVAYNPTTLPIVTPSVANDVITLNGLSEGTYTVTVEDNITHCSQSASVTITMPAPILFDAVGSNVYCTEDNSTITISNITGGTSAYSYAAVIAGQVPTAFTPATDPLVVDTDLTNLAWDVYIQDRNLCISAPVRVNITHDVAPVLNMPAQQCFVGTDITIDFSNAALSTTYNNIKKFTVDGLPTTNNITFTKAGSYKIVLTDDNGCPAEIDYVIEERLTATATVEKDLYCETGNEAAKIVVEVKGGKKDYTYQMYLDGSAVGLPKPATGDFEELVTAPGVYTFAISDSNVPCIFTTSPVTVNVPGTITLTPSQTDVICFNNSNGSLTVVPSGGVAPYKFVLTSTGTGANTTGDTNGIYTDLIQGDYHVVATDAKGCTAAADITIIQPPLLEEDHSVTPNSSCSTTTEIVVTGIGGKGTYQYDFGKGYDDADRISVPNDGSVASVTYTVRDANGCTTAPVTVPIVPLNKPSALTFLPTAITCASGSSNVTVTATNGVGALEFRIIEFNGAPTTMYAMIPTTGSAVPAVFTGLPFGEYKFEVTDSNKCTFADILTIKDVVRIQATGEAFAKSCIGTNDGKAVFTISDFKGTYTYSVTRNTVAFDGPHTTSNSEVTLANLATGTYEISVIDDITNCDIKFSVTVNDPIAVTITEEDNVNANCNTGAKVTVAGHGGTPGYTYSFVPASPTATPGTFESEATRELKPADATSWYVYAKDQNGCISAPITVDIETDPLPAGFTASVTSQCPDADGNYEIVITPGTGMGPFTYSIGNGFQTDEKFTVKDPRAYDIVVRDRFGCETEFPALIEILEPVVLDVIKDILPSCTDGDGQVTASATGGKGPFSYTLDGVRTLTTTTPAVFDRVGSGSHTIVVTDLGTPNNCTDEVQFELAPATPITGFDAVPTHVSCNGGNNGTITVSLAPISDGVNDNPKYMYSLDGGTPQDNPVFKGLRAGTYNVSVTSGRGCEADMDVEITEPREIVVRDPLVSQYGCIQENISNYATITVSGVTGGTGDYTYEFIKDGTQVYKGPRNVYTEMDYKGGIYTINVSDINQCSASAVGTFEIKAFVPMDKLAINVDDAITCTNLEDISITVKASNGTTLPGSYTYSLSGTNGTVYGPTPSTDGVFTDLAIGDYIATVTNTVTGCTLQAFHFVDDPNTFEIIATPENDKVCYDATTRVQLTFVDNQPNPTNDAGPFEYTITGGLTLINNVTTDAGPIWISNLKAGQYKVVARLVSKPECTVEKIFTIEQPPTELVVTTTQSEITCISGNNDGKIVASATGGWPGEYLYELRLGTTIVKGYNSSPIFENLTEGNYTVYAKDGYGCESSIDASLLNPKQINVSISATPMLTCYDNENGVLTIDTVNGGSGNYTYTLHGVLVDGTVITAQAQGANQFTDLKAGTYYVTVNDTWNCTNDSNTVTIDQPEIVKATLEIQRTETCEVVPVVRLTAIGGVGPYYYSADDVTYTGPFSSYVDITLPVTTTKVEYKYFVKDSNGCRSYESNYSEFSPVPELTFERSSEIDIKCKGGATGSITVVAKGGLGNYIYTLQDASGTDITPAPTQDIPGTFTHLPIGNYIVKVTSSDCKTVSTLFELTEPDNPLLAAAIATPLTCNGYNNGKITVNATGGVGAYKYAIEPEFKQFFDKNVFENLKPGFYDILVQDENDCYFFIENVEVKEPDPIGIIEIEASRQEEHCAGDKDAVFEIEVAGGTMPYSYSLDNQGGPFTAGDAAQTRFVFNNLEGGTHTVYILDANKCTQEITINMALPVTLNPTIKVDYDCVNNAQANMVIVTIDPSNTDPTQVTYSLDNNGTFQPSNIFTDVAAGPHYMVVRHTNGCEVTTDLFDVDAVDPVTLIDVTEQTTDINTITVKASGGFAPYEYSFNGEPFTSSNSYRIYKSGIYKVIVRDKNGCEATIDVKGTFYDFCLPNYFTPNGGNGNTTIGPDCGALAYKDLTFDVYDRYGRVVGKYRVGGKWDGRYNGNELPTGDYWYVLKLNDPKDPREFVGHFTLYR
ncbi:T9SS type B sorting domain-containing protein [Flavobacterium anhuiense]|uniref:T9SS type B sorting domain-containing protein n=2 Tax=Flavobacterium TaxID=237 RepID=UPI0016434B40|nr:T9SS type B sorting domain-containing protein [Flavobacterium anhuiense]MCR4033921.1 T9SS type B sorting domain-containing protein [Flavobacterium panacis]